MALHQIHRSYSRFIFNACKNTRIGAPRNPIATTPSSRKLTTIYEEPLSEAELQYLDRKKHNKWFHNPKRVGSTLIFFSLGVALAFASGAWITVPYSGRTHFVLFYKFYKFMGKFIPDGALLIPPGEPVVILPPDHPDYITASKIFEDINHQASEIRKETKKARPFRVKTILDEQVISEIEVNYHTSDEYKLDEGCEIAVVDWPLVEFEISGTKMYVTTGMLEYFRNHEAMIATIFGHEVGHGLAKHDEEKASKFISLASRIGMSLYLFSQSTYIRSKMPYIDKFMRLRFLPRLSFVVTVVLLSYLPMMKCSREIEAEADYIGLMLAASAGYSPADGSRFRVHRANKKIVRKYPASFYPLDSEEEMCERLSENKIMSEAIVRYNKGTPRKPPSTD